MICYRVTAAANLKNIVLRKMRLKINHCYKFLNIIPRANLLFQAHTMHLPLLRKAPAVLLKNATTKNRNFQNFKLVVPLKRQENLGL